MDFRLSLLFFFFSVRSVHGNCFKEDVTWVSDILDILEPVANPYLCQSLCGDLEDCSAFTWTTKENLNFESSCFIFAATSNQTTCKECISGPASCTCSSEGACSGNEDNILDAIPGVEEEAECQDLCAGTTSCMFYTWYDSTSFPLYTCILLTSCDVTDNSCSGCFSGPTVCSEQISTTEDPETTTHPETTETTTHPETTTDSITDLLYLGNSKTVLLPSFSPAINCLVPDYPISGLEFAVTGIVNGDVMICGGYGDDNTQSSCHSLVGNKWTPQPAMQQERYLAAASMTDDGLLVTGGLGPGYLSSTEYLTSGQWVSGPDLPVTMQDHCQVTTQGGGVIVTGGYYYGETLASVYLLQSGRWEKLQDMPRYGRWAHSCVVMGDQMFVLGGYGYGAIGGTSDILTISTQKWMAGPTLATDFYMGQAVVFRSTLYVVYTDGKVIKLNSDMTDWEQVASIGELGPRHQVNPPPVVTSGVLGC